MIETGDFLYEEGRCAASFGDDHKGCPPALEMFYEFTVLDAPDPDAVECVKARIVIDGEGEAGRLEIRGNGYIGYDENGFVNGHFDRPPKMLLDHGVKLGGSKLEGKPELSREEWLAHIEVTRPRTSAEYDRAIRAHRLARPPPLPNFRTLLGRIVDPLPLTHRSHPPHSRE